VRVDLETRKIDFVLAESKQAMQSDKRTGKKNKQKEKTQAEAKTETKARSRVRAKKSKPAQLS
jgi:hypothetical protein